MQLTQHVVIIENIIARWGVLVLSTLRDIVEVLVRTDARAHLGLGIELVGAGGWPT